MTVYELLTCAGLLVSIHGSDAVEDGLVVLGDALEVDPDNAGVNVGQPSSPLEQKHKFSKLELDGDSLHYHFKVLDWNGSRSRHKFFVD